jgi:membrane protease YdiL (CAAX protease family)
MESWALMFPPPDIEEPVRLPPAPEDSDVAEVVVPPIKRRGHPLIAWAVILILVAAAVGMQTLRKSRVEAESEQAGEQAGPSHEDAVTRTVNKVEVRYLIGAHALIRDAGDSFLEQLRGLRTGSVEGQLEYAIYAGELAGPQEALKALRELGSKRSNKLTAEQKELLDILLRLYTDYAHLRFDTPSVSPSERDLLPERLGWAGELALVPEGPVPPSQAAAAVGAPMGAALAATKGSDPDRRAEVLAPAEHTFLTIIAGAVGGLGLALFGLVGLGIMGLLVINRQVRSQLAPPRGNGGIYAETFAVWMLLFLGLALVVGLLLPPDLPAWGKMALNGVCFFASLAALFWPVLRGIPWSTVRREIGWTAGRGPALEALWGGAWYVMSLPILLVGLILTLILIQIRASFESGGSGVPGARDAAHPIVGEIALADPVTLLFIFLLASVAAPIIEETFFRGVLYRHLREATGQWGVALSVLLSGGLVSFIFAVIHPQGYLAVPVLMALAFGFTLARESRGTLIPCMVAHGLNNGIVLLISVLMLSG